MVEDHVEEDLEAGHVESPDRLAKLPDLSPWLRIGAVGCVGGEEGDRVVSPVVDEPPVEQEALADEVEHGEQLDRGHAERPAVLDHRLLRQSQVGAAYLGGDVGMELGQPADVGFVDHRVPPGNAGRKIVSPVEGLVDDQRQRGAAVPQRSGPRIDQQRAWLGTGGGTDTVAVERAGAGLLDLGGPPVGAPPHLHPALPVSSGEAEQDGRGLPRRRQLEPDPPLGRVRAVQLPSTVRRATSGATPRRTGRSEVPTPDVTKTGPAGESERPRGRVTLQ